MNLRKATAVPVLITGLGIQALSTNALWVFLPLWGFPKGILGPLWSLYQGPAGWVEGVECISHHPHSRGAHPLVQTFLSAGDLLLPAREGEEKA